MALITKLILEMPAGHLHTELMNFSAEFALNSDPAGPKLNLSAAIPHDPKITIEQLQKKSLNILFEILKDQFDVTASRNHAGLNGGAPAMAENVSAGPAGFGFGPAAPS